MGLCISRLLRRSWFSILFAYLIKSVKQYPLINNPQFTTQQIGMMNMNRNIYRDLKLEISQEDMYARMKEQIINFISNIFYNLSEEDINHNEVAKKIKFYMDTKYGASWHCVVGKGFGAGVTYNNKNFLFLYISNKAIMIFRH